MPRKLVTVRRVASKAPIPNAERLEAVTVEGWTSVTTINTFRLGDLAVFFEVDSFLPASDPRWNFLEKNFRTVDGQRGFHVKTTTLRGTVSQGLLLPMSDFPEIVAVWKYLQEESGGDQNKAIEKLREVPFEHVLGVTKWEPSAQEVKAAVGLGPFPDFIPRTDQERVQNLPLVFQEHGEIDFQMTTKMDGSWMTVYFLLRDSPYFERLSPLNPTGGKTGDRLTGRFGVCSRNLDLVERDHTFAKTWFWDVALANNLPAKLEKLGRNLAIQGELCGSSVQRNFEGFPRGMHDFFVFAAWDIDKQRQLLPRETEDLALELGLKHVPVLGYTKLNVLGDSIEALQTHADGLGVNGKKREGIVLKEEGGYFSFKVISNSYLLKHGE